LPRSASRKRAAATTANCSGLGDDFDLTKPLGANVGAMGDTGTDTGFGPEVAPPPPPTPKPAPESGSRGGPDVDCACGNGEEFGDADEWGEEGWIYPIDTL
jgi:hypothetical protein